MSMKKYQFHFVNKEKKEKGGQTSLRRLALGEVNFLTVLTKAITKVRPAYVRGIARIQGKEVGPTRGPGMAWVTEPVNSTRSRAFS